MHRLASVGGHLTAAVHDSGAAASTPTPSPRLAGMGMWMDVMRDMEHLMHDYRRIFDGWQQGGVTGMVIGPLVFDSPDLIKIQPTPDNPGGHAAVPKDRAPSIAFDPDPSVYQRFGVSVPPDSQNAPYSSGIVTDNSDRRADRQLLTAMLQEAHDRGLQIMIFQAQTGAGPDSDGEGTHHLANQKAIDATCARIVDTLQQFPMCDGFILDGPVRPTSFLSSIVFVAFGT